jgi:hypothetical protein
VARVRKERRPGVYPSILEACKRSSAMRVATDDARALEREGATWLKEYLEVHAQSVQEKKQHHVHPKTGCQNERKLLEHCRRADDPLKCKGDFLRDEWL